MPDKGPGRREDFHAKPGGSKQDNSRPGGLGRPTGDDRPRTRSAAEMSGGNSGGGAGGGNSGGGICGLIVFGGTALAASGIFGVVEAVRAVL